MTSRSGPSGGNALQGSLADLFLLDQGQLDSIRVIGGKALHRKMQFLLGMKDVLAPFFPEGKTVRRLSGIPDQEGKTRVIAILDYWSQSALRPVHDFLFRILRPIPQDMTFNQGGFLDEVAKWGSGRLYSVDLTKATDRFPIRLISRVLGPIFPRDWVLHWENLMVGRPFTCGEQSISYSVGNPMGAYSS